jgi:hypothetical protein
MVYKGEQDNAHCPPEGELVILSDQAWIDSTPAPYTDKELGDIAIRFVEYQELPGTFDIEATHDSDGNQIAVLERAMIDDEIGL